MATSGRRMIAKQIRLFEAVACLANCVRFWEPSGSGHPCESALRCGQHRRAQCPGQHVYRSSGQLFERLPGSGRRGRRFKSGHPDQLNCHDRPADVMA